MSSQRGKFNNDEVGHVLNDYAFSLPEIDAITTPLLNEVKKVLAASYPAVNDTFSLMGRYLLKTALLEDEVDLLVIAEEGKQSFQDDNEILSVLKTSTVLTYLDAKEDGHRFVAPAPQIEGFLNPTIQLRVRILL